MQVTSEMFSNLQSRAASLSQSLGLDQSPAVLTVKQKLQYLLSAAVSFLQTAGMRVFPVPVGSVQGEGTAHQQVSSLRRAASVAMDLLHKIKAVSAYLCSSLYSTTVSTGGKLAQSLQAEWKNFKLSNRGKNVKATADKQKQEDSESPAVVDTTPEQHALPLEPVVETAEPKAEEMESHPEKSAVPETEDTRRVAEDVVESVKEETCSGDSEKHQSLQTATDSSQSQQPLQEQTSLHQENEVSTATMRPHSKNIFFHL